MAKEENMTLRRQLLLVFFFWILATQCWSATQGWLPPQNGNAGQNKLNDTQNATAEVRKAKGQWRATTNDDRKAAARRTAERKARHEKELKSKGGAIQ